jgi:hypothetical protein
VFDVGGRLFTNSEKVVDVSPETLVGEFADNAHVCV